MPRGPKGEKRPADVIGAAVMVGRIATGEIEEPAVTEDGKNAAAVALGRLGGRRGRCQRSDARAAETPMVRGPYKKRDAEISN
jgi:hypothetical protein